MNDKFNFWGAGFSGQGLLGTGVAVHWSRRQNGSDAIDGSMQQVGVKTQHVPSGWQEFCSGHQLQDNGLHVLEEREKERGWKRGERERGGERGKERGERGREREGEKGGKTEGEKGGETEGEKGGERGGGKQMKKGGKKKGGKRKEQN